MVVKPIAGLILIAAILGTAFAFREEIGKRIRTPEEVEQEKKRNERGDFANTQAFFLW